MRVGQLFGFLEELLVALLRFARHVWWEGDSDN